MFALAIWEPAIGSIFLARDRMGQKPLYLAVRSGQGLAFASELAALRAVPWIKWEIDLASVKEYLSDGLHRSSGDDLSRRSQITAGALDARRGGWIGRARGNILIPMNRLASRIRNRCRCKNSCAARGQATTGVGCSGGMFSFRRHRQQRHRRGDESRRGQSADPHLFHRL